MLSYQLCCPPLLLMLLYFGLNTTLVTTCRKPRLFLITVVTHVSEHTAH